MNEFEIDLGKVAVTNGGEWSESKAYERLTYVRHGKALYVSLVDNKGVPPADNPTIWTIVAIDGRDGQGSGSLGTGSGCECDPSKLGDKISVKYDTDGQLYWMKNGEWLRDPTTKDKIGVYGGGIGDTISVERYTDGKIYWKKNGRWLLDPDGNMIPVSGATSGGNVNTGASSFKSIVFKRTNKDISKETPQGGSYTKPVPDGWSDGVPAGGEILWISTRWFYSDAALTAQSKWTAPSPATDTSSIDFEWSKAPSPGTPETNPSNWHNDATPDDIWMAMRHISNGVPGAWQIIKVKGENGRDGADATQLRILGSKTSSSQLPSSKNQTGDCYIIDGHLWVWDGDSWEDCGNIKGTSNYIHVRYSNDGGVNFTSNNGTTPGKYIGIIVTENSNAPTSPSAYTWSLFRGEDGFNYEYIYMRNNTLSPAPDVPTEDTPDDTAPDGWTDNPIDVDKDNRYLWMASRVKKNGTWQPWRGNGDTGKALLFVRWGRDGIDANQSFKSIIFTRTNGVPPKPNSDDGDFRNPVPTKTYSNDRGQSIVWSDGIPKGDEKVWMCSRVFASDGSYPQDDDWSTPSTVSDTAEVDYVWSSNQVPYPLPDKQTPSSPLSGIWSETSDENTIWMAWRKVRNGEYEAGSSWNIVKVKGETGSGLKILGSLASQSDLPQSDNNVGDAYIIEGDLWVWDGSAWKNTGRVQGPAGVGIASVAEYYAESEQGVDSKDLKWKTTIPVLTKDKPYLWNYEQINYTNGTSVATTPQVINKYVEGRGISSIVEFYLATTLVGGVTHDNVKWSNEPLSVSADKPFLWNYELINFSDGTSQKTAPVIIGHWGMDGKSGGQGVGIKEVKEWYGLSSDPMSEPTIWKCPQDGDPMPSPTATEKYLWNYEEIFYTDHTKDIPHKYDTPKAIVGTFGIDGANGRGILRVEEYYTASKTTAVAGDFEDEDAWRGEGWALGSEGVPIINKDKPYLWNIERIVFDTLDENGKNEYHMTYPVIIGFYTSAAVDDLVYLKSIFGEEKVEAGNGVLLKSFIGVRDTETDSMTVAMMNASSSVATSSEHGKLLIGAGMNGVADWKNAKFKVYEDGRLEAKSGVIGGFEIAADEQRSLVSDWLMSGKYEKPGSYRWSRCSFNSLGITFQQIYGPTENVYSEVNIGNNREGTLIDVSADPYGAYALKASGKCRFDGDVEIEGCIRHRNNYVTKVTLIEPVPDKAIELVPGQMVIKNRDVDVCFFLVPDMGITGEVYRIYTRGVQVVLHSKYPFRVNGRGAARYSSNSVYYFELPKDREVENYRLMYDGEEWITI